MAMTGCVVRAASSVSDVLADPIGAFFAGTSFMVWFQPELAGAFAFDRLAAEDLPLVGQLLVSPVLSPNYDLLCDFGAVEVFDERTFELLAGFLASRSDLLGQLRRFALVRPGGLAGAGLAGLFYERVQPVVVSAVFSHRAEALGWLGYRADAPERAEIERAIATVHAVPPALRELRALLVTDLTATLDGAARALHRSARSLQRELADAGTAFRDELTRARVRIAEGLLTGTDLKVEAIARQIGFASVPAFSALFKRIAGESPVEFRRRRGRTTT